MNPAVKRIVDFRCEPALRAALTPDPHRASLPPARQPVSQAPDVNTGARVLVLAEVSCGKLEIRVAEAVGCARRIGGETEVALLSTGDPGLAAVASQIKGVARVLEIEAATDPALLASRVAGLVRSRGSSHVLAPASAFGKVLMARLAEQLRVPVVPNVMRVVNPGAFARPLGRKVIVTVETTTRPVLATVMIGAFDPGMLPNLSAWRSRTP